RPRAPPSLQVFCHPRPGAGEVPLQTLDLSPRAARSISAHVLISWATGSAGLTTLPDRRPPYRATRRAGRVLGPAPPRPAPAPAATPNLRPGRLGPAARPADRIVRTGPSPARAGSRKD